MSEIVDEIIKSVTESEPSEVIIEETEQHLLELVPVESVPKESAPEESVPEESTPEKPVVEESTPEEPVVEESTPEEPVVEEPVVEESPSTPITTQEVIQNVLEILSSTEKDSITTSQSEEVDQTVDNNELENRMIILEER